MLFNAYDYRYNGVRRLLDTAPSFDRVTYISATPIERKYYLEELKHLPEYRIEWPNAKPVNIRSHKVDRPLEYMAGICRNRIADGGDCNYHIFLNSVEDIASIIHTAKLTPANTRVVCSQGEETLRKNLAKLPEGFGISNTLDELKTISFYTSTCFEGQDIIDPNGRSFIVSHAQKDHTMLDISTTFIQICGRIRKSDYNDEIVHLYSTNRYLTDVSLEEFEQATYKVLEETEKSVIWLNSAPEKMKPKVIKQLPYLNEPYIKVVGNDVMIDRNMANFDIVNYKIVNNIYQSKCNVISELMQSGANITNDDDYTTPDKIQLLAQRKISFKDLFELYCTIMEAPVSYSLAPDYRLEQIENKSPLVKEAYNMLGKDEVRRMKYHQSNIKRELIKRSGKALDYKIVDAIGETILPQRDLPVANVKRKLQSIYDDLEIRRRAKATDLKE